MIRAGFFPDRRALKRRAEPLEPWMDAPVMFPAIKGGAYFTDPLVITALIGHYRSRHVFIDNESSTDIMYEQCFGQLDPEDQARLEEVGEPVSSFSGETVHPIRQISFEVTLGTEIKSRTEQLTFLVLPVCSRHNIIIGRPGLATFNALPSTIHGAIGFPTSNGVVYADRDCILMEPEEDTERDGSNPKKWKLNPNFPEQAITLGGTISDKF
jgi:hypothetical protein